MTQHPWRFPEPPNTTSFTTIHVIERRLPILLVTHDAESTWQFLCGTTNDAADGRIIGLDCALELDPTIEELADLPLGGQAWRDDPSKPCQRAQLPEM